MADDLLRVLCALAAFTLPLLFVWFTVRRGVRRYRQRARRRRERDRPRDRAAP